MSEEYEMAFIAVDKNKEEFIYSEPPIGRIGDEWEDEPMELK